MKTGENPVFDALYPNRIQGTPILADYVNLSLLKQGLSPKCAAAQAQVWAAQDPIWSSANYLNGIAAFASDPKAHCIASFAWKINVAANTLSLFDRLQLGPAPSAAGLVDSGFNKTTMPFGVHGVLPQGGLFICRDNGGFYAMSSICTHQQCDLAYSVIFSEKIGSCVSPDQVCIVCKCHQSPYDRNGHVTNGPAEFDLQNYAVVIGEDGALAVDMSQRVPAGTRY